MERADGQDALHPLLNHAERSKGSTRLDHRDGCGVPEHLLSDILKASFAAYTGNDFTQLEVRREINVVKASLFVLVDEFLDIPPLVLVLPIRELRRNNLLDNIFIDGDFMWCHSQQNLKPLGFVAHLLRAIVWHFDPKTQPSVVLSVVTPHQRTLPVIAEAHEAERVDPVLIEFGKVVPALSITLLRTKQLERVVDCVERRQANP